VTATAADAQLERLSLLEKIRLILEILAAYPGAQRLVRRSELHAMIDAARNVPTTPHCVGPELEHTLATRLGVAVTRTLRLLPTDARCLVRSVVLTRLLTRRGISSKLVIGVTPGEEFAAHAWVEHERRPVLPPGRHERLIEL
jgi:hypothetical protein